MYVYIYICICMYIIFIYIYKHGRRERSRSGGRRREEAIQSGTARTSPMRALSGLPLSDSSFPSFLILIIDVFTLEPSQ